MSLWSRVLTTAVVSLIGVILVGLFARRRAASCWTFVAYLTAV